MIVELQVQQTVNVLPGTIRANNKQEPFMPVDLDR